MAHALAYNHFMLVPTQLITTAFLDQASTQRSMIIGFETSQKVIQQLGARQGYLILS